MKAFGTLRNAARDRRDRAIKLATDQYAATLRRISALEQDLLGRDTPGHKTIADCIKSVLPNDRTFTTVDVLAGLQALDSSRNWRKRSIDCAITQMRKSGYLLRIKLPRNNEPAVYALASVDVDEIPFANMTLVEVVADQLSEPMTQTELVVKMLEAGYQTSMSPKQLRDAVGVAMRKGKGKRFRKTGEKWRCV